MALDNNKKKRKEPLPDNYENIHKRSKLKKKTVTLWYYYQWWSGYKPKWAKLKKYHDEAAALEAVKQDMASRSSWNHIFKTGRDLPFYWIGDNPPEGTY